MTTENIYIGEQSLHFDEFAHPSDEMWLEAVRASLRGAAPESLYSRSYEGIERRLLYRRDLSGQNELSAMLRPSAPGRRPWLIAQEIDARTVVDLQQQIADELAGGAGTIIFRPAAGEAQSQQLRDIGTALADKNIPLHIFATDSAFAWVALLFAGPKNAPVQGLIANDPFAELARNGTLPAPIEAIHNESALLTRWAIDQGMTLQTLLVDTSPYHEAGGHAVQEMGIALATGVAGLRAMQKRGINVEEAASRLDFRSAIGSDFFMEIAKLRALHLLWPQITDAFGVPDVDQPVRIHAYTGERSLSVLDPYTNILRTTTAALAAAFGGIHSLCAVPYDRPLGVAGTQAVRLARNIQLILQEESNLAHIVDPTAGSWYVESLTTELAERGWAYFQRIEAQGGISAVLESGWLQAEITATAAERVGNIATGQKILVGVNRYMAAGAVESSPRACDSVTDLPAGSLPPCVETTSSADG